MKILRTFLLTLFFVAPAFGQFKNSERATATRFGVVKPDNVTITISGGGTTNGQTAAQVSAAIAGGAILQTNGVGTNAIIGTLTVLHGKYKDFYLANGAHLRTNTIAPFDWEFHNTNGVITFGTNTVTKRTLFPNGDMFLPQTSGGGDIALHGLVLGGPINSAFGNYSIDSAGNFTGQTFTGLTFTGAFTGDGNALTNLPASAVTGLLVTTNLAPSTYASFNSDGFLTSTLNGRSWTNFVTPPSDGDTNFVVEYPDGTTGPFSLSNLTQIIAHGQSNLVAGVLTATNGNGTNFLWGRNYFTNNIAPIVPLATTGNTGSFTNNTGTRAMLSLPYYYQTTSSSIPCGTVSNRVTGRKFVISQIATATQFVTNAFLCPPCSPGDVWDFRNESAGGGVFAFPAAGVTNEWYPVN